MGATHVPPQQHLARGRGPGGVVEAGLLQDVGQHPARPLQGDTRGPGHGGAATTVLPLPTSARLRTRVGVANPTRQKFGYRRSLNAPFDPFDHSKWGLKLVENNLARYHVTVAPGFCP